MKKELTARQEEILNFISDYIDFNGFPPTYREIGKQFDISSTFGVKRHLDALTKKGYLNVEGNVSRAMSLTRIGSSITQNSSGIELIELPVVGRVAAGQPILAQENIEGTIALQSSLIRNKSEAFGLRVKGDSMMDAGILEGDIVIVNPQKNAENGEIVVAMLEDEATLKRYEMKDNTVYLIPENQKYSPIVIKNREDFLIIGKVMGVFRWYN